MGKSHVSGRAVDDEIGERTIENYLTKLDPMKLFFEMGDVGAWEAKGNEIDNEICAGDLSLAAEIHDVLLERIEERLVLVNELLNEEFDFEAETERAKDGKNLEFANSEGELRARWRTRIKYNLAQRLAKGGSREDADEKVARAYERVLEHQLDLSYPDVVELYLTAFTKSFDPHSAFMSVDSAKEFRIRVEADVEGIGVSMRFEDDKVFVAAISPGGAVAKEGTIQVGDEIVGVAEGKKGEFQPVEGLRSRQVASKIRGKSGTIVRLQIRKADSPKIIVVNLTRARIQATNARAFGHVVDFQGRKIAILTIPGFYRGLTAGVRNILSDSRLTDASGLVIDLRYNGGGLLTEAVTLTGLFINDGVVLMTKGADGQLGTYKSNPAPKLFFNKPLVVLTSRHSASASEIFAGAMQDYGRAAIVGDTTTHGKGTVQVPFALDQKEPWFETDVGLLKVTIQQFFRPGGESTQIQGVEADVVVPSTTDHATYAESTLKHALDFATVEPASVHAFEMVNDDLFATLREASTARVEENEEFAGIISARDRSRELTESETVPFSLALLTEQGKSAEAGLDTVGNRMLFGDVPYENEILEITSDYLEMFEPKTETEIEVSPTDLGMVPTLPKGIDSTPLGTPVPTNV